MVDKQKGQHDSSLEHKKKVLWGIFAKLDKVSQGCGEVDLPLFGETLLMQCEELIPEFESNFYMKLLDSLKLITQKKTN